MPLLNTFFNRRERNYCKICWWTSVDGDFETSSISVGGINGLQKSACCGYGYNGNYGNARAPTGEEKSLHNLICVLLTAYQ